MDRWIFPTILLCIPLCLGLLQNQGNQVFEPTNLRIYSNDSLQQLLLEWDVSDDSEAYNSQIDIIFNIQVRLREENESIILNVNYTTVLNKSRQLHQWGFISKVPLQCATHEARIRSKVVSSEIWSNWSYWVAANGPDALSGETNHFFPKQKVFERGSNITFCCIAKKNESVSVFNVHNTLRFPKRDEQRALLTLTPESSFPHRFEFGCFFSDSGNRITVTHLYLTRQPDKPQNLKCGTEDRINIKCTWDPEYVENVCPMDFMLYDVSSGKVYCSRIIKNTCSFKMGDQFLYHLRLNSRNCRGEKNEEIHFDVKSTGQPDKPQNLKCGTEDRINIKCTWDPKKIELTEYLYNLCPMEFILSDVSSGRIHCSTKFKNTCSFNMGDQFLYNVSLTSRNCFGQKKEQFHFDVNSTGFYREKKFTASDFPLTTGSTAERPFSFHPVASLFLALLVLALCQPQRTAACRGCHSGGCRGSGDAAAPMAP